MRLIITIIVSFFYHISFSQDIDFTKYYSDINNAEIAVFNKAYASADSVYRAIFKEFENGYAQDFLNAAKNSRNLDNIENTIYFLIQGFKNGLQYELVKKDDIYHYLKKNNKTGQIKKIYKEIRKKYIAELDVDLRDAIAEMVKEDQKYRKWWYNRKPWPVQQQILKKVDAENFDKILAICKEFGFPGRNLVGDDGNEKSLVDVPTLLRHMDSTKLNILKPYVLDCILKGKFQPYYYVSALDYVSMIKTTIEDLDENGNHILIIQQEYGTMLGMEDGINIILPVRKLEGINNKRAEFCIEPIEDYALKNGCDIPREGFYKRTFKKLPK
jgi:hypothetical protein